MRTYLLIGTYGYQDGKYIAISRHHDKIVCIPSFLGDFLIQAQERSAKMLPPHPTGLDPYWISISITDVTDENHEPTA